MKRRIIYNPTFDEKYLKSIYLKMKNSKAGYETSCHATTGEGDATNAATKLCREFDVVIAVGGDEHNEVVAGVSQCEKDQRSLIPMGNDK